MIFIKLNEEKIKNMLIRLMLELDTL